jgi:hypothetical protein
VRAKVGGTIFVRRLAVMPDRGSATLAVAEIAVVSLEAGGALGASRAPGALPIRTTRAASPACLGRHQRGVSPVEPHELVGGRERRLSTDSKFAGE